MRQGQQGTPNTFVLTWSGGILDSIRSGTTRTAHAVSWRQTPNLHGHSHGAGWGRTWKCGALPSSKTPRNKGALMTILDHINPRFGIHGEGNCLIGPHLPMGLVRPGPDSPPPHKTNGLNRSGRIARFSQTHVSGTGGAGRYGNVSIMPYTVDPRTAHDGRDIHQETARPGYYRVQLAGGLTHEITCTHRVALHRTTFPQESVHGYVLDPLSLVNGGSSAIRPITALVEWLSPQTLQGWAVCKGGWGHSYPYQLHFYVHFDQSSHERGILQGGTLQPSHWGDGIDPCAYARFEGETVCARIGISHLSIANARSAVESCREIPFDDIAEDAARIWERELDSIALDAEPEEMGLFYSAFYRLLSMPTDLGTDENPWWHSPTRNFTDYYCFWDSARNANGLLMLIRPDLQAAILKDQLDIAAHIGWFPDAWINGHSACIQGGCTVDAVFAEAALKELPGVDYDQALSWMTHCAQTPSPDPLLRGRHPRGDRMHGYLTPEVKGCVSRHLEYAFQDDCIARMAAKLGRHDIAHTYAGEARTLWNLWHPDLRCFAPRDKDGTWMDFDPWKPSRKDYWHDPYFYEGTAHEWSLTPIHALPELIARHGGSASFERHLDHFFANGLYFWKEIILHTPYLYHSVNRPDKVNLTIQAVRRKYANTETGLPDNEDMGSQSAFLMATTLGLYPMMGGSRYWLSTPRVREATLRTNADGNMLRIRNSADPENPHPAIRLNGTPLPRWWVEHHEIRAGGELWFA